MNWKRCFATQLSSLISQVKYRDRVKSGYRVLMYHSVGGLAYRDVLGLYHLDPVLFRSHVETLLSKLPRDSFVGLLEGLSCQDPAFRLSITFDDGYSDNLTVAAPVLIERDLPFTVFVTSNFIGREPGFVTNDQLRELSVLSKVTIGAHGATHRPLSQLSQAELRSELRDSKKCIEDIIGRAVNTMSCPYGATNTLVRAVAREEGYVSVSSSHFGINDQFSDPFNLSRIDIVSSDTSSIMWNKVQGAWDWISLIQKRNHSA